MLMQFMHEFSFQSMQLAAEAAIIHKCKKTNIINTCNKKIIFQTN